LTQPTQKTFLLFAASCLSRSPFARFFSARSPPHCFPAPHNMCALCASMPRAKHHQAQHLHPQQAAQMVGSSSGTRRPPRTHPFPWCRPEISERASARAPERGRWRTTRSPHLTLLHSGGTISPQNIPKSFFGEAGPGNGSKTPYLIMRPKTIASASATKPRQIV